VDHKTLTANGLRFAYLEQGRGPLVLLLHGFPDTAHTWDRTLPALAEAGYRAVAPFGRGYFPTEIPRDGAFDSATLGNDALAMIEALGEASAIVVGHDWGASAAYAAATLGPERVKLLVTIGIPHPRSIKPTPRLAWTLRHFPVLARKRAADALRANDFAYVDALVKRWSPAWTVPPDETARVKAAFCEPGVAEAACAYYRAQGLRMPRVFAAPISVPAVAFAGTEDSTFKPRAFEKARLCFTASYEVVQVPGGHFMHREHPDVFVPELVRVVREAR
jgi:pimeloyl-ACP methyl ester carboxylesterase